jgi:uncharacterized protein YcfJ
MKKNMVLAALVGVTGLLSAGALAGYLAWKDPAFAEVVSVEPVRKFVAAPDKSCADDQIVRRESAANEPPASGVVINGMAGGMITRQPARLEKVATLGAVAAGDPAGRAIQDGKASPKTVHSAKAGNKTQAKPAMTVSGADCRKTNRVAEKIVAYDVRYRFRGKTTKVRMDHDPGKRLPVRDGKVVIVHESGRKQPKA